MDQQERKAAAAAFRERKSEPGIYALTCRPTGERWVGRASDLASIENRLAFALKMASTPHRSLQAAARAHGAEAFTFEVMERLDSKDESEALVWARLKKRLDHWRDELGATSI
ncbi:MAG TPA: GIY-YIG nuclease family protein [Allosphingosinicella sp.]|jgi:hypothetical protein|nr:GIY-YIG nuclease family protein [Allosphingosinicella sp.]